MLWFAAQFLSPFGTQCSQPVVHVLLQLPIVFGIFCTAEELSSACLCKLVSCMLIPGLYYVAYAELILSMLAVVAVALWR